MDDEDQMEDNGIPDNLDFMDGPLAEIRRIAVIGRWCKIQSPTRIFTA
jgi:hypothetical protein